MRRNEGRDVATKAGDLLDHAGADEGIGFLGHHENRFNVFIELAVHQGELELEFKVGNGAKSADDRFAFFGGDIIDEQAGKGIDFNVGEVFDGARGEFLAAGHAEHGSFTFVDGDSDDDAIKKTRRALDYIQVTVGDWIETSRVYGCPHGRTVAECRRAGKG